MFYAKDSLAFKRLSDGGVKVVLRHFSDTVTITLDCDTWASVVASMSAAGETHSSFDHRRGESEEKK